MMAEDYLLEDSRLLDPHSHQQQTWSSEAQLFHYQHHLQQPQFQHPMMPLVNKTQHHQPMDEKEDRRDTFTEEELTGLPIKELNRKVRGMPREKIEKLRQRRRRLRNRDYGRKYRDIHQAKLYELEANLNHENEMMDQLTAEMEQLWGEIEATKVKCKYLSEFAKKNNIPIKDLSTTHHDGQSD